MTLYHGLPEYYLTLVAWVVNNGIWNILVASGVFALPFVAIVIQEWLKARSEGADEDNKGVLSSMRIENRVWVAIVVIMFAGHPVHRWISPRSSSTPRAPRNTGINVPLPKRHGLGQRHHARQPGALVPV